MSRLNEGFMREHLTNRRRIVSALLAICALLAGGFGMTGCSALGNIVGGGLGGGLLGGGTIIPGPAGVILSLLTSIKLVNPLDTEFSASATPTPAIGYIQDVPLGRNIAATAIFTFDSVPASGTTGPNRRIYYTERVTGRVRSFNPVTLSSDPNPVLDLAVNSSGHRGLIGICFTPDGSRMFVTYVASTTGQDSTTEPEGLEVRVSSFPFANGGVSGAETILVKGVVRDPSFASDIDTIGKCEIGPDGRLYFAHGDLETRIGAQDTLPTNLAGKILRIAQDGSIPSDNPFADSPSYCIGLRNPTDFTFDATTGQLWIVDQGSSVSDELNKGASGANFGWPLIQGIGDTDPEGILNTVLIGVYTGPTIDFGKTRILPTGVNVLRNSPYGSDIEGDIVIGQAIEQSALVRFGLNQGLLVARTQLLLTALESGEILDTFAGPDGYIYIVTSIHLYRMDPA